MVNCHAFSVYGSLTARFFFYTNGFCEYGCKDDLENIKGSFPF